MFTKCSTIYLFGCFIDFFSQLHSTKRELETTEGELQALRDTYTTKHDVWIKEKLNMQVSIS